MLLRRANASMGPENCTLQRPLNNLTRSVIMGVAAALSSGNPAVFPPYDEPLGLGWSLEASQLSRDATRVMRFESKLGEVLDPLAGSYYVEALTDELETACWKEVTKIDGMGGAVGAIENGYMQREIAKSAHERQKRIERGEDLVVGVNCFTGEYELDVQTTRLVPHPYDPVKREEAELKQINALTELKKNRDSTAVRRLVAELKEQAKREDKNLIPHLVDCVKGHVSLQEMCDVLRDVFGEYQPVGF
jgi:methylmalonyl-CoA mutase N-terminal domain/subunit